MSALPISEKELRLHSAKGDVRERKRAEVERKELTPEDRIALAVEMVSEQLNLLRDSLNEKHEEKTGVELLKAVKSLQAVIAAGFQSVAEKQEAGEAVASTKLGAEQWRMEVTTRDKNGNIKNVEFEKTNVNTVH